MKITLTIRSGGQTGVDRGVLDAALNYNEGNSDQEKFLNINVTGGCPKGRKAEDGIIPLVYPLIETPTDKYPERTECNVRDADATLVLLWPATTPPDYGTENTIKKAEELCKPLKRIFLDDKPEKNTKEVIDWMKENKTKDLNVAGPRESNAAGIREQAHNFMTVLLNELNKRQYKVEEISLQNQTIIQK